MENQVIIKALVSQYKAGLGMLKQTIEKIPADQWNNDSYSNPNWQIAYHTVWSIRFYLARNTESYVPYKGAVEGAESLGGASEWENSAVELSGIHSKEDLSDFISQAENMLQSSVESLALDAGSGFEWYPYTRLELHINTIRHIQHHTAQLVERLKANGITGFPWWADENSPQW